MDRYVPADELSAAFDHAGFRVIAEQLSTRPGFAEGLDAQDAATHLSAVQSEETHALLLDECG